MDQIKRDNSRLVLIADEGVAMVVMDKKDYMDKATNLLEQLTYRFLPAYPTNKCKVKWKNIRHREWHL